MKHEDNTQLLEVFAGNPWEVAIVQSLLENAEIECCLQDETIGTLLPWQASAGGVAPVRIFVADKDYEKALLVVKEYEGHEKE